MLAAIVAGDADTVQALVESGADVNDEREKERTPLMFAAAMGEIEMVETLLRAGAKRHETSKNGWTAAALARLYGHGEVYHRLESGAADSGRGFSHRLTVDTEPGVAPPRLVEQVPAEYTDDALARRIEGQVALRVAVLDDGRIGAVELTEGLDVGLDLNAIEAVRQWKFRPSTRAGQPVPWVTEVVAVFSLPESSR